MYTECTMLCQLQSMSHIPVPRSLRSIEKGKLETVGVLF